MVQTDDVLASVQPQDAYEGRRLPSPLKTLLFFGVVTAPFAVFYFDSHVERLQVVVEHPIDTESPLLNEIEDRINRHSIKYESPEKDTDYCTPASGVKIEGNADHDDSPDEISLTLRGRTTVLSINTSKAGPRRIGINEFPSRGTSVGFDDIDGDGFVDAWCGDPGDACVRIWWGDRYGKFKKKQWLITGGENYAFWDMNDDGVLDILVRQFKNPKQSDGEREHEYKWLQLERV